MLCLSGSSQHNGEIGQTFLKMYYIVEYVCFLTTAQSEVKIHITYVEQPIFAFLCNLLIWQFGPSVGKMRSDVYIFWTNIANCSITSNIPHKSPFFYKCALWTLALYILLSYTVCHCVWKITTTVPNERRAPTFSAQQQCHV